MKDAKEVLSFIKIRRKAAKIAAAKEFNSKSKKESAKRDYELYDGLVRDIETLIDPEKD